MSKISKCPACGGNIVEPAYEGDGAYPVPPMCSCNDVCRCWCGAIVYNRHHCANGHLQLRIGLA